jgi:hypothetical protein
MIDFDGTLIFGFIVTIGILLVIFCVFVLLLGYGGIFWFALMLIVGLWMGLRSNETDTRKQSNDYFTDEDFLHCKVGEWVSRP